MRPDGFLNLLKPPGMTSHDVVAFVRATFQAPPGGRLGTWRVGHLGTLDPAAAGVLPISLGRASRLFAYAAGPDKAYRAEITLGLATDTMDAAGAVTAVGDSSALTRDALSDLLTGFAGEIEQVPPAFSAVQVEGRRLYELARRGEERQVSPRKVRVWALELVGFWAGRRACALVDLVCSPGTYVRALAADLGRAAGCGAYLSFLVRTRVGRFQLADALTLEECRAACEQGRLEGLILPLDWPLAHLPQVGLDAPGADRFVHGTRLALPPAACPGRQRTRSPGSGQAHSPRSGQACPAGSAVWRVYGPDERFLGLGGVQEGLLCPQVVLAGHEGYDR